MPSAFANWASSVAKNVPIGRKKSDARKVTNAIFRSHQQVNGAVKKQKVGNLTLTIMRGKIEVRHSQTQISLMREYPAHL
jgi:hypothetical protein